MDGHHDRTSGSAAPDSAQTGPAPSRDPSSSDGDPLSDVLQAVHLSSALFFFVDASLPWASEAPDSGALAPAILPRAPHLVSYHVVLAGSCWCSIAGEAPLRLEAGDAVVVPHGEAYALSSEPGLGSGLTRQEALDWFRQMAAGRLPLLSEEGGGGTERIRLICGFLGCDALPFNPVLSALPRMFPVRKPLLPARDRLGALIELAAAESREPRAGSRSVLLRIGELMFVEVVRRHLAGVGPDAGDWLAGLRDPLVGRALARLHQEPARGWTLDALAREVAASRSVLSERFVHFVGQPPMRYLTNWRVQLAAGLLADRAAKVSSVARQVGYDSEAAFSRAFKKVAGVAPASWRARRAGH